MVTRTCLSVVLYIHCLSCWFCHRPGWRSRLATGQRFGDRIQAGARFFLTRRDRPWGQPNVQYNGYLVSFPGVFLPLRGVDHSPPSSAKIKERIELGLFSHYGPSLSVPRWRLPFTSTLQRRSKRDRTEWPVAGSCLCWWCVLVEGECDFSKALNGNSVMSQ